MLRIDPKWMALLLLILQNSGLALMMRFTMLNTTSSSRYSASTAVLLAEILKLLISIVTCFIFDASMSFTTFTEILSSGLLSSHSDWLMLTVPSILYTLQNLLQYFSMSMLSAPVFQVLYQMKIITTAIFSVAILSKRITSFQWIAVIALSGGVALVQLSQLKESSDSKSDSLAGLLSVLCGCLTSGFAGVFFEKMLKSSNTSVWIRNIQLSMIGAVLSLIACYTQDQEKIQNLGFFNGYNSYVYGVIFLQAAGGMLVAVVVKYADNVLKGFATSLSILCSCVVSSYLFHDVDFSTAFLTGSVIVLLSVFAYGYSPPVAGTKVLRM